LSKTFTMTFPRKHNICLVGHPFAPIGMGEHVRSTYRAFKSVAVDPGLRDIYQLNSPNEDEFMEFSGSAVAEPCDVNIFHINGDEVEQALAHLSYNRPWSGHNIIYPAWELSRYPSEWGMQLDRFDEIWAPSFFIQDALKAICQKPVLHMPLACEVVLTKFLSRRYFGISETDFVFLFFFDVRSYVSRKNPKALIDAFRVLLNRNKFAKTTLVLKINGIDQAQEEISQLNAYLNDLRDHILIIQKVMTDNEIKNLVRCCDCFISLHRSEGYGRGMAEAMFLGKPVIATGYSGNMDFMSSEVAFIVDYKLISLIEGEYPHYDGQVWAEPDVNEAANYMQSLLANPKFGREIGKRAQLHIRMNFSYRGIGMRYRDRVDEIINNRGSSHIRVGQSVVRSC